MLWSITKLPDTPHFQSHIILLTAGTGIVCATRPLQAEVLGTLQ